MSGNYKHGHKVNKKASPTYNSWRAMRARCQHSNASNYERYGGQGIKVCDRWQDFENFLSDMGERPEGKTLDRIDNNKGYEPGNCKWSTPKEQSQNRKTLKNQHLFIATDTKGTMFFSDNQHDFARQHNLIQGNIAACLNGKRKSHKGWTFKRFTSLPGEDLFSVMRLECYA